MIILISTTFMKTRGAIGAINKGAGLEVEGWENQKDAFKIL